MVFVWLTAPLSVSRSTKSCPGHLFDLFDRRRVLANPISRPLNFVFTFRGCRFGCFCTCNQLAPNFDGLSALDRKIPVPAETQERVVHRFSLQRAHSAATHRVVKHPV